MRGGQTYDAEAIPWLVAELSFLLRENPECEVFIAATIRNEDTFEVFRKCCGQSTPPARSMCGVDIVWQWKQGWRWWRAFTPCLSRVFFGICHGQRSGSLGFR